LFFFPSFVHSIQEIPKRPPPPDHIAMFAFPETKGVALLVTQEKQQYPGAASAALTSCPDRHLSTTSSLGAAAARSAVNSRVPAPVLFSFVLTDEKGRRLYATALRVRYCSYFC